LPPPLPPTLPTNTKNKYAAVTPKQEPTRRGMPLPSVPARRGSDQAITARVPVPQVLTQTQAITLEENFEEDSIPTREQLLRAASYVVIAQNGIRVPFGDLIRERKTIVVFIRHFWCPLCQDYMYSISRTVNPDAMRRAGVGLVVIGNGSPAMIKSYRHIFRSPFELYTDPTHKVYNALGMNLRTTNPGPDAERGEYVRHGLLGGIAMVVRNALRVGMPVWEKGGDVAQLGGEFVLGPGFTCSYAHRMKNTRAHAPIAEVLAAAG
ncbi:AhpC/TSA antioxidant enzyme-domain-containing protein, partial [Cytidiella melzeri]